MFLELLRHRHMCAMRKSCGYMMGELGPLLFEEGHPLRPWDEARNTQA